jgi:hypothetical protein
MRFTRLTLRPALRDEWDIPLCPASYFQSVYYFRLMRLQFLALFILLWLNSAAQTVATETRDKAIDNISSVLFDPKFGEAHQRIKSFENANGIKLYYRVEDASLDKLGGLSEHLFRIFQNLTSPSNINARAITGEFSAQANDQLTEKLAYRTNATPDLRSCILPEKDTRKIDERYSKFLANSQLSLQEQDEMPESTDGIYTQGAYDYGQTLASHGDCPGIFDANAYNIHVVNTRTNRKNAWTNDANALSVALTTDFTLLQNNGYVGTQNNPGNTGVNLGISQGLLNGTYVLNLNNSLNGCTQEDMEVRCKMLLKKSGINFVFVTQTLNYYLPVDSLNLFRDGATNALVSANANRNLIIALYLKMNDPVTAQPGNVLLVRQNGDWLTLGDVNFASYNNSSTYNASCFYKFNNLYKNIPKPLILCYQVAKVNGLLTTVYFNKAQAVKGREQIYYHVFKIDKAFEDVGLLQGQLKEVSKLGSGKNGFTPQLQKDYDALLNRIKIAYIRAGKDPQFSESPVHFKEVYLQDKSVAHKAALKELREKYGQLYDNNQIDNLLQGISFPSDLNAGTCKTNDKSDAIADALNVASLLLSPTGFDFIPDALQVAYFAATGQTLNMLLASASFLTPGSLCAAKKMIGGSGDVIREINAGSKLISESGQLKAIQQDVNQMTAAFGIKPENVNATLVSKINASSAAVSDLLTTSETKARLYSNVSAQLDEPKRVEFLNKTLDEPAWRQKVLNDPDEVLKWAGVVPKWIDELEVTVGQGSKAKILSWIDKGLSEEKLKYSFNRSSDKTSLMNKLESAKSIYHQRVHIEDWDNIPGVSKTIAVPNGLGVGKNCPSWNPSLNLPVDDAKNFTTAAPVELPAGTKIYRVTGGNATGAYWTIQKPNDLSEVIGGLSVRPEWNSFEKIFVYEVPSGSTLKVWKGPASKQLICDGVINPHLPGSAEQIFVPQQLRDNSFVSQIKEISLPW